METNKEKKKENKTLLYVLVIASVIILVLVLFIFFISSKNKRLLGEKEIQRQELLVELDSLMKEHNSVKVSYGELAHQLQEKDSVINAKADEIKKLLNYEWEYYKIRKKVQQLQEISKTYVAQMDSLYTVNANLVKENTQIKQEIQLEKKRNVELTKEKDDLAKKVNIASAVKATNINAESYHVTGNRIRLTDKANRTDLVKICFSLMENSLAKSENLTIYVRIALPDGNIITDDTSDSKSFNFKGNILQYTLKSEIDYSGKTMDDICFEWYKAGFINALPTGLYYVNLFTEDFEIGQSFFELR